jgi:hypothetical protein
MTYLADLRATRGLILKLSSWLPSVTGLFLETTCSRVENLAMDSFLLDIRFAFRLLGRVNTR